MTQQHYSQPCLAGIAVAFLTVLMAAVKLAAVTTAANQRRNELDEVRSNTVVYADSCRRHNADMEEYNRLRVKADEYIRSVREAKANVVPFPGNEDLRQQIEDYLSTMEK